MVAEFFPSLSAEKVSLLGSLTTLVKQWNDRVNLISRKDVENIEQNHVLMSLFMSKVWTARAGFKALDIGTGGGFPGIPLAILYPEVHFTLCDSIAKKCRAVSEVVAALRLPNVTVVTKRAETLPKKSFDLIIGRAVIALPEFLRWSGPLLREGGGVLYFKGTRWREELQGSRVQPKVVHDMYQLSAERVKVFEGKFILWFPAPFQIEEHIRNDSNTNMHAEGQKAVKRGKKIKKNSRAPRIRS